MGYGDYIIWTAIIRDLYKKIESIENIQEKKEYLNSIKYEDHYQFNLYSGILTVDEYFYDISIENESKLTNHLRTYYECSKVNKLVDINR